MCEAKGLAATSLFSSDDAAETRVDVAAPNSLYLPVRLRTIPYLSLFCRAVFCRQALGCNQGRAGEAGRTGSYGVPRYRGGRNTKTQAPRKAWQMQIRGDLGEQAAPCPSGDGAVSKVVDLLRQLYTAGPWTCAPSGCSGCSCWSLLVLQVGQGQCSWPNACVHVPQYVLLGLLGGLAGGCQSLAMRGVTSVLALASCCHQVTTSSRRHGRTPVTPCRCV